MVLVLKRWRTWLSPAARKGRKAHKHRLEMAQRLAELSSGKQEVDSSR